MVLWCTSIYIIFSFLFLYTYRTQVKKEKCFYYYFTIISKLYDNNFECSFDVNVTL